MPSLLSGLKACLALVIVLAGLTVVSAPAQAAPASVSLPRSTAIAKETVSVTVRAGQRLRRPVRLEYKNGRTWKKWRAGSTNAAGVKRFRVATARSSIAIRARFPKAKVKGATRPARKSRAVVLRTVRQAVAVQVTKDAGTRTVSASVTSTPPRQSRKVSLQRREPNGTWRTIVAGRATDARGRVTFARFASDLESDERQYRVQLWAWGGAPAIFSTVAKVDWPLSVDVPQPNLGVDGAPTVFEASTNGPVSSVRFYVDGQEISRDNAAPWRAEWAPVRGRHDVTARAIGPGGSVLSTVTEFDQPGFGNDDSTGLPAGFTIDTLQAGFDLPTAFEATESGRVFVAEKSGRVLTFLRAGEGGSSSPQVVADLSDRVSQSGDQGMTGLALDPRFGDGSGGHDRIYVSFVVKESGPGDRYRGQQVQVLDVGRWSDGDEPLAYDAEAVILGRAAGPECVTQNGPYPQDCVPLIGNSHTINDLVFDHHGKLLVGVGDGSMFFAGLDGRSQSLRAQDPTILAGKVLRIDPVTGRGVPGNPYYGDSEQDSADPGTSNASRVLALGLRNPFRLSVRDDGLVMIGDVGEAAFEELNVLPHDHGATTPANFGWPCYEGSARTNVPVSAGDLDPAANPWDRCQLLWQDDDAHLVDPVHTYAHLGGASITAGVFYTGDVYPADYRDSYFFGDYAQDFVRTARVDGEGAVSDVDLFAPAGVAGGPVKFVQGPDDRIWYASIYDGSIRVIDYAAPTTLGTCPVGAFAQTFHDLTDSSLQNDPESYDEGWSWLRFVDALFPVEAVAPRECVDGVDLATTSERPHASLPSDRYGIRWQGRVRLEGGTYQFAATGKDWVRLWVDGEPMGEWFGHAFDFIGVEVGKDKPLKLAPGIHTIRVELVHDAGAASAGLTWSKTSALPSINVTAPANGVVVAAESDGGVRHGTVPFEVSVSAADGAPDLTRLVVTADLLHVTGKDQHAHPWSTPRPFDLSGGSERGGTFRGSFPLSDDHAPGNSVFRIRARVEDASGASRLSAPVYVCLEGNEAGICSVS